jgi:hypothetical protein
MLDLMDSLDLGMMLSVFGFFGDLFVGLVASLMIFYGISLRSNLRMFFWLVLLLFCVKIIER